MPSINTVLVANRGEIASRVFSTCRDMGIRTVAVHSDPDTDAPYVAEADRAIRLPGARPTDTYLRADLLIDAALRAGADAVHPGYGFLSESAAFARACESSGLIFVGPSPEAIELMGDKLRSKELMAANGVPVLAGHTISTSAGPDVHAAADAIGYPLLVKASAGGGGRGMRLVENADALVEAIESARREAASAFGDDTVFLEKFVVTPRHIEVQVMGDTHGAIAALFERECSIQRRHQKVIEESPSPAVSPELRDRLLAAAVAAARSVDYIGAGTVEFVVGRDGQFFFLEMNTRLQVEHPVTELVTGLDLVRCQLEVAAGLPLAADVLQPTLRGHAIEARLYAEDVAAGYLPTTGTVRAFEFPALRTLRVDASVRAGSIVSPHYDPMLAKVIAWAPRRDESARVLSQALRSATVSGVTTNLDLLVAVLEDQDFLSGDFETSFLDQRDFVTNPPTLVENDQLTPYAVAAAVAAQAARRGSATTQLRIPSGWRNNRAQDEHTRLSSGELELDVRYRYDRGGALVAASVGGHELESPTVLFESAQSVVLVVEGIRTRYELAWHGDRVDVSSPEATVSFGIVDKLPEPVKANARGTMTAPMPGSVLEVLAAVGEPVVQEQPFIVLEAMKMEHTIRIPEDGILREVLVEPGDQVEAGAVLARLST